MRTTPFPSIRTMARIFVKAVVLLLIANFVCVALGVDPLAQLITINTWGLVGHGRCRLYYITDDQNGKLPLEVMLMSHTLAYTPKAPDEYRVIVLGDSATLGWGMADDETSSAQLTARNLHIGGKRVVAYNLGDPYPGVARDALLLDAAMRYQPDMVIWFVTWSGLLNVLDPQLIYDLSRDHLKRLTDEFGLQDWFAAHMPPEPSWYRWTAIHHPETFGIWLNSLFYPLNPPVATIITRRVGSTPVPNPGNFAADDPNTQMPNPIWSFLQVGITLASRGGAQVLVVNEPILLDSAPKRALDDKYRAVLADYMNSHHIRYLDLGNVVSADHFTDSDLHMDPSGYGIEVDRIAAEIAG